MSWMELEIHSKMLVYSNLCCNLYDNNAVYTLNKNNTIPIACYLNKFVSYFCYRNYRGLSKNPTTGSISINFIVIIEIKKNMLKLKTGTE